VTLFAAPILWVRAIGGAKTTRLADILTVEQGIMLSVRKSGIFAA
jgi:hypothetical protein